MPIPTRAAAILLAALPLLAAGCGPAKLDEKLTFPLPTKEGPEKVIELNSQPKEQTITVEFTSTEGDIEVYILDAKNESGVLDGMNAEARAAKSLASKTGKAGTVSAKLPANTEGKVVFMQAAGTRNKTDVTARVTNQK